MIIFLYSVVLGLNIAGVVSGQNIQEHTNECIPIEDVMTVIAAPGIELGCWLGSTGK